MLKTSFIGNFALSIIFNLRYIAMIHFAKHQPELSPPIAPVHMTQCLGLSPSTANQFGTLKGRLCSLAFPKRKTYSFGSMPSWITATLHCELIFRPAYHCLFNMPSVDRGPSIISKPSPSKVPKCVIDKIWAHFAYPHYTLAHEMIIRTN